MHTFTKLQSLHLPLRGIAVLLALGGLAACSPDATTVQESPPADQERIFNYASGAWPHPADTLDESLLPTQEQVASILKDKGFSQFEFEGKSVLVEGDMVFHRSDFLPDFPSDETPALGKVAQLAYSLGANNRVSRTRPLRIWVDPGLPFKWRDGVDRAIYFWSRWGGFRFERVKSTKLSPDMIINAGRSGLGSSIAQSSRPFVLKKKPLYVAPGKNIRINTLRYQNCSQNQAASAMIHHFGHAFGFAHTNSIDDGEAGILIPGTTFGDPYSIMNGAHNIAQFPTEPTVGDIKAIHYMYPMRTARESAK